MDELKPGVHDRTNGLDYALVCGYYIPAIELPENDDRPTGKRGGCTGHIRKKQTRFCSIT